jgi:hypothetical protein
MGVDFSKGADFDFAVDQRGATGLCPQENETLAGIGARFSPPKYLVRSKRR